MSSHDVVVVYDIGAESSKDGVTMETNIHSWHRIAKQLVIVLISSLPRTLIGHDL